MCSCFLWPLTCVVGLLVAAVSLFFTIIMVGAMVHFKDYVAVALPFILIGYLIWMVYECLYPRDSPKES